MPGENRAAVLAAITEKVRLSPARMTRKRERILGAFLTMDRPASAAEIRKRAGLPATDLVTVYRTIEAFESLGVLQRVPLESGTHLFELKSPEDHFHHLICRSCHKAERLDVCIRSELEESAKRRGFTELSHVMEVYGLCGECGKSPKK